MATESIKATVRSPMRARTSPRRQDGTGAPAWSTPGSPGTADSPAARASSIVNTWSLEPVSRMSFVVAAPIRASTIGAWVVSAADIERDRNVEEDPDGHVR